MRKVTILILLIIMALTSEFVIAPIATNPETYHSTMKVLDQKRTTVLELTGSASAASIAIAAVPGDSTTPIADKIMDLTGYFVIVLCTIVMEKYLLTLTGYLTFKILIPIACVIFGITLLINLKAIRQFAIKIFIFGVMIISVVPISVKVTQIIENTYRDSINQTMDKAKQVKEDVEEETTEASKSEQSTQDKSKETSGIQGLFEKFTNSISEAKKEVQEKISETADSIVQLSEETIAEAEDMVNDFIETVVVMLVTSCVIPMLVLAFFVWIGKSILSMEIDLERSAERGEEINDFEKILKKEK